MITVNMIEDMDTGLLQKFIVEGHAGYDQKGKDIVCASVSALTISTIKALESRYQAKYIEKDGFVECNIIKPDKASSLITMPFIEGIKIISEQYDEYVNWHLYSV